MATKAPKKKYNPRKSLLIQVKQAIKHIAVICVYQGIKSNSTLIDYRTGDAKKVSYANELAYVLLNQKFYWEITCIVCGVDSFNTCYAQDVVIRCKEKYTHADIQRTVEGIHDKLYNETNQSQLRSLVWITRPIPTKEGMRKDEILKILTKWEAWENCPPVDRVTAEIAELL